MNSRNSEFLNRFIDYLRNEKRYSEYTINAYKFDVSFFINYIEKDGLGDLDEIDSKIAEEYIYDLGDKRVYNYTPKTIHRKVSSLSSLYKYYFEILKEFPENPFIDQVKPKVKKVIPNFMYLNDCLEFINKIDTSSPNGLRDKLIFSLLLHTGLRVSELTNLEIKDINTESRVINVIGGKGSKDRIVKMDKNTLELLKDYYTLSRPYLLSKSNNFDNQSIFLNHLGTSLTSRGVRHILNTELDKTCSTLKCSPHTFRHTFATVLLNKGMDVRMVQELLGHESLATTQIYTKASLETTFNLYNKCFPKGDKKND